MSDFMSFRKKDDHWKKEHNKILENFNDKFRALCEISSKKDAAKDIEILLRNKYLDVFSDREGSGLIQRIQLFDRVLAGEVDPDLLMDYDKDFYRKSPRKKQTIN